MAGKSQSKPWWMQVEKETCSSETSREGTGTSTLQLSTYVVMFQCHDVLYSILLTNRKGFRIFQTQEYNKIFNKFYLFYIEKHKVDVYWAKWWQQPLWFQTKPLPKTLSTSSCNIAYVQTTNIYGFVPQVTCLDPCHQTAEKHWPFCFVENGHSLNNRSVLI